MRLGQSVKLWGFKDTEFFLAPFTKTQTITFVKQQDGEIKFRRGKIKYIIA